MTQAVQSLIGTTMQAEFKAFLEQLEACPAEAFSTQPAQGHSAYGHSVAWHALHIMDWTRCVIQPDLKGVNPALTYGYLGFEPEPWAQAVYGPTLAHEQDSKEKILMALDTVFAAALSAVQHAPAERFSTDALWTTLKKPKPVLNGLMYHIRHVAYHRGQVQHILSIKNKAFSIILAGQIDSELERIIGLVKWIQPKHFYRDESAEYYAADSYDPEGIISEFIWECKEFFIGDCSLINSANNNLISAFNSSTKDGSYESEPLNRRETMIEILELIKLECRDIFATTSCFKLLAEHTFGMARRSLAQDFF